ncbi:unnamed protein product [Pieris macdunnoughi]|uniref:Uncharacterized protein n=1 Tax=Pieris macdunnoughi TaxID=345717 RepID=A0A821WG77_9NEOP|nr:unnamed protein product [Pieris macdunnoughi]
MPAWKLQVMEDPSSVDMGTGTIREDMRLKFRQSLKPRLTSANRQWICTSGIRTEFKANRESSEFTSCSTLYAARLECYVV